MARTHASCFLFSHISTSLLVVELDPALPHFALFRPFQSLFTLPAGVSQDLLTKQKEIRNRTKRKKSRRRMKKKNQSKFKYRSHKHNAAKPLPKHQRNQAQFFCPVRAGYFQPNPACMPRILLASWISFCITVTLLAWNASNCASSKRCTMNASAASCRASKAWLCHRKSRPCGLYRIPISRTCK